jgi:hypothetical protein
MTRRQFVQASAALAALPLVGAAQDRPRGSEELVRALFKSLTDQQKKIVALPWDDKRRTHVSNNWNVVEPTIGELFSRDQRALLSDIFKGLTSGDGHERFERSMEDDSGGFDAYTTAIFGDPTGGGPFQWVMTGRHLTVRCDGDSTENAVFGGPIFYGHAVEFHEDADHSGNVWWHEALQANRVFAALDGKQREKALLPNSPPENLKLIRLRGDKGPFDGIPVAELTRDQKPLVEELIKLLLSPFRASDVDEAMKSIRENGGLDRLHLAYFKEGDLGEDGIWDRWSVQGPAMTWHFRGSPHVHCYVNLAGKA